MDRGRFQRSYLSIFLSYYKPHLGLFLLDMCCALGISLVDLAFPYASRMALNELLPQNLFAAFFGVMAILLAAYGLRAGMHYIVTYWGHMMGVRIEADIRRDLFSHMQNLSFSFYDQNRTGQLMSRATNDLFEITELAHHGPEDLFISVVTLGGAFVLMCTIQWKLALIVFAVVPIFVLFTIFQRRKMVRASLQVKQNMAGINGQLESAISGMRTAKAFANEDQEGEKFRVSNDQFKGAKRGYYKAMAGYMAGLEFALPVMNVLTIAAGGFFIMRGEMDLVDLVTFSLYISTFLTPVRKLAAFVEQFLNGMAGFKRFVELMRVEPEVKDAPDAQVMGPARGDIRIEDVSFAYSNGETVLSHINIHIPQGRRWRWWDPPGAANPPCASSSPGSMTSPAAAFWWTGWMCGPSPSTPCAPTSASSSRTCSSSPAPSWTTSATAGPTPPRRRSLRRPSGRRSTTTSWTCPTASRPMWASGGSCCPAARSSGCPSPGSS